jgi:hypothetical protein
VPVQGPPRILFDLKPPAHSQGEAASGSREQDLEPEVAAAVGTRDLAVSLLTHSDMRELMTSVVSGLVLASMADGVFWDTEGNEITRAAEALE